MYKDQDVQPVIAVHLMVLKYNWRLIHLQPWSVEEHGSLTKAPSLSSGCELKMREIRHRCQQKSSRRRSHGLTRPPKTACPSAFVIRSLSFAIFTESSHKHGAGDDISLCPCLNSLHVCWSNEKLWRGRTNKPPLKRMTLWFKTAIEWKECHQAQI